MAGYDDFMRQLLGGRIDPHPYQSPQGPPVIPKPPDTMSAALLPSPPGVDYSGGGGGVTANDINGQLGAVKVPFDVFIKAVMQAAFLGGPNAHPQPNLHYSDAEGEGGFRNSYSTPLARAGNHLASVAPSDSGSYGPPAPDQPYIGIQLGPGAGDFEEAQRMAFEHQMKQALLGPFWSQIKTYRGT